MASSQSVSVRIASELLEQLDAIAVQKYPLFNGNPNRSKTILYLIEVGIASHNGMSDASQTMSQSNMSDDSHSQSLIMPDSIKNFIQQQVAQQVLIQMQIQQQLRQYNLDPASQGSQIAELRQEVAEIKKVLESWTVAAADNRNTVPDDCNATSDDRDRPEQSHSATVSTQPQQDLQPQFATQLQPDTLTDKRSTTSDDCITTSDNRDRPEQSHPAATETPAPTQPDRDRLESAESDREQSLNATVSTPAPQESPLQSTEPASEPIPARDRHSIATENQSDRPEESHPTTASTPVQQESQPQSATPASEPLPDRDRPEQSRPAATETPAPTQFDRDRSEPASSDRTPPEQRHSATAETQAQQELQPLSSTPQLPDRSAASSKPDFPEWMTAKQAFEFLGGDPGDRDSSISSVDGLKQIRFSTFKSKTSSELKPFGLELSQDQKRRRQPCYRLLKNL